MEKLKKNKNGNKRMNKQKRTMREKKNKERKLIRFNIKVIIIHKKNTRVRCVSVSISSFNGFCICKYKQE